MGLIHNRLNDYWGGGGWLVHVISNTMDNDIRDGNAAQYFVKRVEKLLRIRIYLSFWKKITHTKIELPW